MFTFTKMHIKINYWIKLQLFCKTSLMTTSIFFFITCLPLCITVPYHLIIKFFGRRNTLWFGGILVQKYKNLHERTAAMNENLQKCSYLVTTLTLARNCNPNREDLHFNVCREKKLPKKNMYFHFAFTFHILDAVLFVLARCS